MALESTYIHRYNEPILPHSHTWRTVENFAEKSLLLLKEAYAIGSVSSTMGTLHALNFPDEHIHSHQVLRYMGDHGLASLK